MASVIFGYRRGLRIGVEQLQHGIAELCLAKEKQAGVSGVVVVAVARRFGRYVRQVDALAEHVAIDVCFGRCDAEALR